MTKQTWTAAVSAVLFVVMAAVVALVPVPFVSWSAGSTVDLFGTIDDKPRIEVLGAQTHPVSGQLRLTTVSVTRADAALTLPEALLSHWLSAREVLPRQAVYPAGMTAQQVQAQESQMMDTSQQAAVAAGLRAAGIAVSEIPMVTGVSVGGPANEKLQLGDFITAVDRAPVTDVEQVREGIRRHQVGEAVVFTVVRDRLEQTVTVTTTSANNQPNVPVVGINLGVGYSYEPRVTFGINPEIGGPSAGLMFALGVYDKVTPGDLVAGRSIAGTGTITGRGEVGAIGGIQEKIAGAERAGATVFLVPAGNCADVGDPAGSIRLVKVATLTEAVAGLEALADPARAAAVAGCR